MSELADYDYDLPRELIAQRPLNRRSDARLLVVDRARGTFSHRHVRDLAELLSPADCLVVNDTRVVPARLVGRRSRTGGRWEGLFLSQDEAGRWKLLGKTRGKLEPGETITLLGRGGDPELVLRLVARQEGGAWLAVPESHEETAALLERVGRVPLPHYIRDGEMVDEDLVRYQTVFAKQPGAVAAPTAGLHFSEELLARTAARGTSIASVTLHVGLGTFRPITTDRLDDHEMHQEWGQLSPAAVETICQARSHGGRVIAVGTTSVRVLETASQHGTLVPWSGWSDLYIRPGYRFRMVDCLLTNFHLPRTTLLVLVRTFGGNDLMERAYSAAIQERYRFYSYGDAMLIL